MLETVGALPSKHVVIPVEKVGDHLGAAEVTVPLAVHQSRLHEVVDHLDTRLNEIVVHIL